MIRVLINSANGKMGQEVIKEIENNSNFELVAGFGRSTGSKIAFPVYQDIKEIKENIDVIIDFSVPESTFQMLEYAKENKKPIVIATTGFTEEESKKIIEFAKYIPVFRSANMSYEVNLMAKLVAELASKLPDSDIEITDIHHNKKVDSPSGTALLLADSINEKLNNEKYYEYNRHDKKQKRDPKEIGIHSIRGGTVVGTHTVSFFGENESFEITHTVTSRSIFARGALKAANFMIGKPVGFYNMNDMVN